MKALIFVISLFSCVVNCLSQPLDKHVSISGDEGSNKLYARKLNLFHVLYKIDTFHNILVTSSQGKVSSIDKYFHYLSLPTKGGTLISVFDTTDGKKALLARRSFDAETYIPTKEEKAINKLSEKVHISIEDFSESKIPLNIVKKATRFKVTSPYKIKTATIYIGKSHVLTYSIKSGNFDSCIFSVWARLSVGSVITLDNVIVVDRNNKPHKINGRSFVVIED